jgi:hypothetical protein
MKTERICNCDWCSKWSPLIGKLEKRLGKKDKILLNEFISEFMNMSDDAAYLNAKAEGLL